MLNMKKMISVIGLLVLMMVFVGCADAAQPETTEAPTTQAMTEAVTEAPTEVPTESAPVVVAGTVTATRILHGLGVPLTAIPETSKELPAEVASLPTVGLPMNPNIELVMSFEPEHFITDASLEASLSESLTQQNIPTIFLKTSGYADILEAIGSLGDLFGKQDVAAEMIAHIESFEAEALDKVDAEKAPTVAIIFGTPESFMLATSSSYVGNLASKLSATNITDTMEGARAPFVPFSLETLAEMNPDYILRMTHVSPEQSKQMFDDAFNNNPFYDALQAVKNEKVIDLDSNYFGVTATIDCGEALLMLANHLYGE